MRTDDESSCQKSNHFEINEILDGIELFENSLVRPFHDRHG